MRDFAVGLCALVGVVGVAAWVWLFDPFIRLPAPARDLPGGFEAADEEFKARLAERCGPPMEPDLVADLEDQGFEVHDGAGTAQVDERSLVCGVFWRVWDAEDGRVTAVSGRHGAVCL